ncbi:MAG: FtsK/SpoIIIE domain-containing protein [Caldilineaceae bacterium]
MLILPASPARVSPVLLQTMLLSLCAGTSPDDLKLVLVDLKNEDLVPFECLPHVLTFAGTREAAVSAIQGVVEEKDRRIKQRGYKPYRLVLVIDEMAQLAGDNEVKGMLGDLASIGRSKAINLIGATQHPTDKGGLGTLLKANFPVRLVGMVAPGQSYIATGRPQTHADLLPGKGAFLRCQGPDVYRFQSFYIEPGEVEGMARHIARDAWGRVREPQQATGRGKVEAVTHIGGKRLRASPEPLEPVLGNEAGSLVVEPQRTASEPVLEPFQNRPEPFVEPLEDKRPLTKAEAIQAQELYQTGLSKTALCKRVYGSKNGQYMDWINEALDAVDDGKIISLKRKAG